MGINKWSHGGWPLLPWVPKAVDLEFLKIPGWMSDNFCNSLLKMEVSAEFLLVLVFSLLHCVLLFVTPWTVAHQALLTWHFPGKNTGVVAISYSWASSVPRDQMLISCISQRILYPEPPGKPHLQNSARSKLTACWFGVLRCGYTGERLGEHLDFYFS